MNIINVLISYYNNDYINNKIIKKVLQKNYEKIKEKTLEKRNQDLKLKNKELEFNNKELYDLYIELFYLKENEKIFKKKNKYKNVENFLNENEDKKFISYEKLKENLNKINNDKNGSNNIEKERQIILFCISFLKSNNFDNKKYINLIMSKLIELKEREDEYKYEGTFFLSKKIIRVNNEIEFRNITNTKIKKNSEYIGIKNIGHYDYLNSVIQQLFMIPEFKYSILSIDDKNEPIKSDILDDDNMLHQLQKLFTYLSFTSFGEVIPRDLILSIKDYNEKTKNLNSAPLEFYINFCDKIEEYLKCTKYKYLIKNLFVGKICYINNCSSCNNNSYKYEEFKYLSLEVEDLKNIYESFDKYISTEYIEDYYCLICKKKITYKRSIFISNLPNILVIHLRINMNDEKLEKNYSRFEFPKELDLKKYCIENNVNESGNIYKKK